MASTVRVTTVSLLLLVCGSLLRQASAGTPPSFLDTLSLYCGKYGPPEIDGRSWSETTVGVQKPLDIPGLNKYFPVYYMETTDGKLDVEALYLFEVNNDGTFVATSHNLVNNSIFRNPDVDVSKITLDDLDGNIRCREEFIQAGVPTQTHVQCFNKPEFKGYVHEFIYTCEYYKYTAAVVPDGEDMWPGYVMSRKLERFSLPDSWLEGIEDYKDPCSN